MCHPCIRTAFILACASFSFSRTYAMDSEILQEGTFTTRALIASEKQWIDIHNDTIESFNKRAEKDDFYYYSSPEPWLPNDNPAKHFVKKIDHKKGKKMEELKANLEAARRVMDQK